MICGKVIFNNIKDARIHGKGPCAYYCKNCGGYHTSNMSRKKYKQMHKNKKHKYHLIIS